MRTSYAGDTITLTVPGGWLAEASFPVVIDPLLNPIAPGGALPAGSVDVVRDDVFDHRFVAFTVAASRLDRDVRASVFHDDWTAANAAGGSIFLDTGTWDTPHVRCATVSSRLQTGNKLCMVYNRVDLAAGDSHLVFHVRDVFDTSSHATADVVALNPPAGRHDWRPVIGGTSSERGGDTARFLVVWQRESSGAFLSNTRNSQIWAATLDVSGVNPTIGPRFRIPSVGDGDVDQERPAINQAEQPDSGVPTWVVAWQQYDNSPVRDVWDVYATQLDGNGNLGSAIFRSQNEGNGQHKLGPQVAGQSGRYCLVYSQAPVGLMPDKPQRIGGMNVTTERFDWDEGGSTIQHGTPNDLGPGELDPRFQVGDIGFDHEDLSHWVLTFVSDRNNAMGDGAVHVVRVGYRGHETEHVRAGDPATATESGVPGGVFYDDDNEEFLVGWAMNDVSQAPGNGSAWLSTLTYAQPVPWSVGGAGCSLATISLTGNKPQQIGNEFMTVHVTGAQADASHVLLLGLIPVDILIVNPSVTAGCRLLVPVAPMFGHVAILPGQVGADVSWTFALPETLSPGTVYFQDWHISPSVPRFFSTQRLEVPLIK